jgi:hypothetical protein
VADRASVLTFFFGGWLGAKSNAITVIMWDEVGDESRHVK